MWAVSEAYSKAVVEPSRQWKAEVQVTYKNGEQVVFTDETIMNDIVIYSQMVSGDEGANTIDIGAVPEKKIELTLIDTDSDLHRYTGAQLSLTVSLMLENGEYENVPMGLFFVDSSALSRIGTKINIVGYDGMVTFQYTISDSLRTRLTWKSPTDIAKLLAAQSACGFKQELSNLPNGNRLLNFTNQQIVTGWDGIMWLAQIMGCFARINRQNDLEFIPIKFDWEYFDDEHTRGRIVETRTINESERYDGITFSDDRMHIIGAAMPGDEKYITSGGTGGLDDDANITILLEKNPLLDGMDGTTTDGTITHVLDEILNNLRTVYFYAFQVNIENDPALDAGDVVRLRGGVINGTNKNNDLYGFITHNTWRYRGQHTITSIGQTPIIESNEMSGETTDAASYLQPKSQSEKLINALSVGDRQLNEKVTVINNQLNEGIDRAKYLQTYSGQIYDTATALKTTHFERNVTSVGEIGYEFGEQTNNRYSAWNAMISGKMSYRKETDGFTRHPMESISYDWGIVPAAAIDRLSPPDGINFSVSGHSKGKSFSASAELSCDGLWVSDGQHGAVPYEKAQLFYARYSHSADSVEEDDVHEFVIARVRFTTTKDGLNILCEGSSYGTTKQALIPWIGLESTSAAAMSAEPKTQKVRTAAAGSAAVSSEPSYTYDNDGIHIGYNGHTKVIPWDT